MIAFLIKIRVLIFIQVFEQSLKMAQTQPVSKSVEDKQNNCKLLNHDKNPIQYFCLDELCFNQRLFCQACAKLDHKKHRIGRIDRLIEPLSLLNINSFHEDSQSIHQELTQKIQDFYGVIHQLRESFQRTLQEIERTTFFEVRCILETFSNQKIQEVENLFISLNPNEEDVKNAISMINFLQFEGVQECYTVKHVSDIVLCKMTKSLQKTSAKIQAIFDKLTKNVKQNNFINQLKLYRLNLEAEAKRKIDEGMNKNLSEEDKGLSEPETFDQQPPQQRQRKEGGHQNKGERNMVKEDTLINNAMISSRFKAFFEEQNQSELARKLKKDKNLILAKKEY